MSTSNVNRMRVNRKKRRGGKKGRRGRKKLLFEIDWLSRFGILLSIEQGIFEVSTLFTLFVLNYSDRKLIHLVLMDQSWAIYSFNVFLAFRGLMEFYVLMEERVIWFLERLRDKRKVNRMFVWD